jgi:hypothetical protein
MKGIILKRMCNFGLAISFILATTFLGGCDSDDSNFGCHAIECVDTLHVRLIPTDSYVLGVYSAVLFFSDDVSIKAEFEVIPSITGEENTTEYVITLNNTYGICWMAYELEYIEIIYRADIPSKVYLEDYEFTDELLIQISRDGQLILSEIIAPEYQHYWCGGEPKCHPRQNKSAEIELGID